MLAFLSPGGVLCLPTMADPPQPSSADMTFAHYRVERHADGSPWELGRGAMGVTYKAYDAHLRVDVALKVINPAQVNHAKTQALFLREARAAARVHHSNVASVVFLNQDPTNPFYAMEFIAGESLRDWMQTRCPLAPLLAIGLAEQIALGLAAIHAESVVHRDLKPGNVMIVRTAAGREKGSSEAEPATWGVKIIDFGLARAFAGDSLTSNADALTTGFRGTAVYASPEQCQERVELDGRSDLYSLGCMLWEMLVGAPPFRGSSLHEVLTLHVSRPLPLARLSHLPASLQAVVAQLLAKDPDGRFANATAVVKALEHCRERILSAAEGMDESGPPSQLETAVTAEGSSRRTAVPISGSDGGAQRDPNSRPRVLFVALGVIVLGGIVVTAGLVAGWWRRNPPAAERAPTVAAFALPPTSAPTAVSVAAAGPTPTPIPDKSIAVLPFENSSSDKENAFFADGVQDQILTDLARIADLKVTSRTSVMRYRGAGERSVREIARELGVAYILEGTVQRVGNKVRVTAQLIDARTDAHVWAERYDRDLADVFALQSEIANVIAAQLQAKISSKEVAAMRQAPTSDLVASELYAKARQLEFKAPEDEALLQAVHLLDEAVARDPRFILAYCLLGHMHLTLYFGGYDPTPARRDLANAAIQNAARLQPDAGEVHLAWARYFYRGFRDYDRARTELALAQRTLPNDADVYFLSGAIDRRQGRWTEAINNLERAVELDPQNVHILLLAGGTYEGLRRYAESNRVFERAVAISPGDYFSRIGLAIVPFLARADVRPLRAELTAILIGEPGAAEKIADVMFRCALAERDSAAVNRAVAAIPAGGISPGGNFVFPREWFIGLAARTFDDAPLAQSSFGAARTILEKLVREQPDYAQAWSLLGQIDAALGRKEEAVREGRHACELLPLSKDAAIGAGLIRNLATIYAWSGETDLALEHLTVSAQIPMGVSYGELKLNPQWDALRGDPRFQKIVASLAPKP